MKTKKQNLVVRCICIGKINRAEKIKGSCDLKYYYNFYYRKWALYSIIFFTLWMALIIGWKDYKAEIKEFEKNSGREYSIISTKTPTQWQMIKNA